MTISPKIIDVHHVGLSVSDLAEATAFFVDLLGFGCLWTKPDYPAAMVASGNTRITLWQVEDPANCRRFDRRRNEGLHHLALEMPSQGELDALYNLLVAASIKMEFAPQPVGGGSARHMMCFMPGGPRMEFIAPDRS